MCRCISTSSRAYETTLNLYPEIENKKFLQEKALEATKQEEEKRKKPWLC
jgi:hypothetical protein